MGRMNGPGTVIQKSYVSSTVIGKDGKKQHEKYFSNNVAHKGTDGNTVNFIILLFFFVFNRNFDRFPKNKKDINIQVKGLIE